MSSRNDIETQLWGIVTQEVAMLASATSRLPRVPTESDAIDDAFLRDLQALVDESKRELPAVRPPTGGASRGRAGTSPLSPLPKKRVSELVWSLRQLISGDSELVALVAAYERGSEGADAAAEAGLSREAHRAALRRLKVVCEQLDLFGRARPTRH